MSDTPDYTNIGDIKKYLIENVAPNYFDLDTTNNYQIGVLGYMTEIMGNAIEDGLSAVTIAKREFYPPTAKHITSLYKMATLHNIDIGLTKAATCKCMLMIDQAAVLEYTSWDNGVGEFTIDSTLNIFVEDLTFMIDYPIKILTKKNSDVYTHTIYYDTTVANSLDTSNSTRYIKNTKVKYEGVTYLVLMLDVIRQLTQSEQSEIVVSSSILETITMDFTYSGNLANFEVFYKETAASEEMQLTKILVNALLPAVPYVQYEHISSNKIRLTFEYNNVFNPVYNSEVVVKFYISEGEAGNFNSYANDIVCTVQSETYAYNQNLTIIGRIQGSSAGGTDKPTNDVLRERVMQAYCSNNTITTVKDLQLYFDEASSAIPDTKVLFKKIRDDVMYRLFGAYVTMKDTADEIIPTNALNLRLLASDMLGTNTAGATRMQIQPGTIFEYSSADSYEINPTRCCDCSHMQTILDMPKLLANNSEKMYFTNPFLINIGITKVNVGYYQNSIDETLSVGYNYVNDDSVMQFIASATEVYRNAVNQCDYYSIKMTLMPTADLEYTDIITEANVDDPDYQIIAKSNGTVVEYKYIYDDDLEIGYTQMILEYDDVDGPDKYQTIITCNTSNFETGYTINGYIPEYQVGDSFIEGNVVATRRVIDKRQLLLIGDISNNLIENGYFVPFNIQAYDPDREGFVMEAFISTNDEIDSDEKMVVTHGINSKDGAERQNVGIKMGDIQLELHALYNNKGENVSHRFSGWCDFNNYTLTNSYMSDEDELFNFVTSLPFVRGTVRFLPDPDNPDYDWVVCVSQVPLVGAEWTATNGNYDFFITRYNYINDIFTTLFYQLENNFSIDSKFYNTYGKSRFYSVGNNEDGLELLDKVKCSLRFAVRLGTVNVADYFLSSFRSFVKEYIETMDDLTSSGKDIYIFNLITALYNNFSEIEHIEYNGCNNYSYNVQKIVGPNLDEYWDDFIPEFVNLATVTDGFGDVYPDIEVTLL